LSYIGGFPVPVAPLSEWTSLRSALDSVERSTRQLEDEAVETWWRTVDLRTGPEWRIVLATPTPELLDEGVPLQRFCSEVARGRPLRSTASEEELPGSLPVADVGVLRGGPYRRWVMPGADVVVAQPGDVLVAETGPRSLARIADADVAAHPSVFVMRLLDRDDGPKLVRFLNGQEGYARRRVLQLDMTVPVLRKSDLAQLPVPHRALEAADDDPDPRPLGVRLEQLLWS
jgi:hypothetical protein